MAGTPVKSCMTTRAGVKAISLLGCAFASQVASASMSFLRDGAVAFGAEQVLEQDLEAEGQAGDVVGGLQGVESEDVEFAVADAQLGAGVEAVVGHAPDVTSAAPPEPPRAPCSNGCGTP